MLFLQRCRRFRIKRLRRRAAAVTSRRLRGNRRRRTWVDRATNRARGGGGVFQNITVSRMRIALQILVALIVVGVLLWIVNSFNPMAGSIKSILNSVVVIAVFLWLLKVFGLMSSLSRVHLGR